MSQPNYPTVATLQRGPLSGIIAEYAPPGTLVDQLVSLIVSDPVATNRALAGVAGLGMRHLPMGTMTPSEKALYGKYKTSPLVQRRGFVGDALLVLEPYGIPFAVGPARLQELGDLQASFKDWRVFGQQLVNLGMDRRAMLGPMQLMLVTKLVEAINRRFRDPALKPAERSKLLDDFAPALLELERVLSMRVERKEELKGARADAQSQLAAATADAAYAATLVKLRQGVIVSREELFAAARRHQELKKGEGDAAKAEVKETPKAPGPRRLL